MSRTKHHRSQKHAKCGQDFGAKYQCDKGYSAGTGAIPKELANTERRIDGIKIVRDEISQITDI